jgi:hypothetical protein
MIERFGGRYLTKAGSHEILEPPAAAAYPRLRQHSTTTALIWMVMLPAGM